MSNSDKDPKLPKILGSNQDFKEKVKNWDIGMFGPRKGSNAEEKEDNPGDVTIPGDESHESDKMEFEDAETESQKAADKADEIIKEATNKEPLKSSDAHNEPPEYTLTDDDEATDEERLRKEALETIPENSKKRPREDAGQVDANEILAKARSEAQTKKAMLEQEAMKGRRILLYLPEKGANFKDIMTALNCEIERTYNEGIYKGLYKTLRMEREARWDRDNKVGQIYPGPSSDAQWILKSLNEVLKDVKVEAYPYLYRDFIIDWEVAILLLNGSALVDMKYDREKVLDYLERNMGDIAKLNREDWRLISISQPRVIKRKVKAGEVYFDEEGVKHTCEEAGQYMARTGNALTTLHMRASLAATIKTKGSVIPFLHGPVKIKWGNPEVVFKKDLQVSVNTTPLGPGPGASSGGLGSGPTEAAPAWKPRKFVEKPEYQDPNKLHLAWAERSEEKEEQYEDIVKEFMDHEARWEQAGKEELRSTIEKFKYLLENPTDEDDISVKSYRTDAGTPAKASTAGLTKGQKKNLAIKKKTLCDKAMKIRKKRVTKLEEYKERLAMCYCPIKLANEREDLLTSIQTDIILHNSMMEGKGVIMEHD